MNKIAEKPIPAHTPGPWRAFYKHKYDEWHISLPSRNSMRIALASDGIQSENREADAYLIAAAPELLDTLKAVVRIADRETVEFAAARAAIAKAEGRDG